MSVKITTEKIKEIAQELDCGMKCFYDITTGDIESYPNELKGNAGFDEELWQETINKIESNYTQYIAFEGMESQESFRLMEIFIGNIKDGKTSLYFEEAISRKKPFQQFKFCLQQNEELQQQRYQFKNEELIKWTQGQLEAYNFSKTG